MKILVTAFDPFGGESVNPALEAVQRMKDRIAGAQIVKLEVPTVFGKSIETVYAAMRRETPDAVVCVGQAGGRSEVTPERVAINVDDARIADNEGNQPIDRPVFADGRNAYFSTLPVKAMVRRMREGGLPSSLSNTAGTFVCNHLMYGVLYHIEKEFPRTRGGFIHVPFIPAQVVGRAAAAPSMSLGDITRGLEYAVEAVVLHQADISSAEGRLD